MHTKASQLFRAQCAQLPQHHMHVLGRMVATMYLVGKYKRAQAHSALIARALEHMDQQLSLVNNKEQAA